MKLLPPPASRGGVSPNGPQAHDLGRELEFERPAQVGATPFGNRRRAPSGRKRTQTHCEPRSEKCYPCIEPRVLPMY